MDTGKAGKAMQIAASLLAQRGVRSPDYVALGRAITMKLEMMPETATADDIAGAIVDGRD